MSSIERLKKHILVDGYHIIADLEKSHGSWIVDKETGKKYLDCYSQFASQTLGWNNEDLKEKLKNIDSVVLHKVANADLYSEPYIKFVETFASITEDFKYLFFIEGGAAAVENALKIAFDWKCQIDAKHKRTDGQYLDVIHLKEAFHGRSGYTLSLTNTGTLKTKWFPKFPWTRVTNPKIHFPIQEHKVKNLESISLNEIRIALEKKNVAAIIFETIQGEGGDNHFRSEFLQEVKDMADFHEAMFILDEIQCGMGITGKWWAYQHYGIIPDILVFGKKSQVCGCCSTEKVDLVKDNVFHQSGRINSTWGGNLMDMVRATAIIEIMNKNKIVENAELVGNYFLNQMNQIKGDIDNIRGKGLMLAFDLPNTERRDVVFNKLRENVMVLKSGTRSIRFRPCLTFTKNEVDLAINFIKNSLN